MVKPNFRRKPGSAGEASRATNVIAEFKPITGLRPLAAILATGAVGLTGALVSGANASGAGEGRDRYAAADAQINPWGMSAQRESVKLAADEARFDALAAASPQVANRDRGVVSGWIPFWNFEPGLASFTNNADLFAEVYGFFHETDESGKVHTYASSSQIARLRAAARKSGVPFYGTVLDVSKPHSMAKLIADPKRRAAHIKELVGVVEANGYDGIDIDYEQFAFADGASTWPRTRVLYVQFIKELSAALHSRGKLLSVATPTIYDGKRSSSSGYWVYDWGGIAPYVDKVGVMTYDYSYDEAGPTAPLPWFNRTTAYAVSQLGEKASMGVPAFGYDWSACSGRNSMTQLQALRMTRREKIGFGDQNWASEGKFTYRRGRCTHTVWFGHPEMFGRRTAAAVNAGAGSIAIWALGNEGPWTWEEIRKAVGQDVG